MKKLILYILMLFSLTLCVGFRASAAEQADIEKMQNEFNTKLGSNLSTQMATQIIDKWQNGNYYSVVIGNSYCYMCTSVNVTTDKYQIIYDTQANNFSASGSGSITWTTQGGSVNVNKPYYYYAGSWQDFHVVSIDWDTVYYSANILPPDLDITYRELSSVPIVDVPLNVELVAEPQNVYVEIDAVFECPDEVNAWVNNGVYSYNTLDTIGFYEEIIPKEDLVLATSASNDYIHLALNSSWEDFYDQIQMSDITWHTDPNYSTNLVNNMKSRFENIRKVSCFYGNELKLFVRYFVINNDTQFVVGSWRIWNSKTPNSYTDQMPTWYQPYIPASGTTGTSSNTGSNTQQNPDVITIPPGSGDPTGIYYNPSTNITVGSNVPNYPDYPTIRSYNADNFLVQTMNYFDYLNNEESEKTLFGEFGHFLASLFVFIPGEIWTIIAVGFSLVIVVMFLKIL